MAGSISKVGTKFRVALDYGKDATGKRIRKYVTATSEAEAKKLLNEFEYNQQRNLVVATTKMTLREFLVHWVDNYVKYNCEETTAYGYRNILYNHIIPYLGNIELQKLQPVHIQQYYKHLMDEKSLSPNTVHKHHACIRKSLDYGLKQQFVYSNAADAVSLPRKAKYEGKFYRHEELNQLLEKVKEHKLAIPIYLACFLGLRREEIVGLKWKFVDLDNQLLYVTEVRTSAGSKEIIKAPKTNKSRRTLHITDDLLVVLRNHKQNQEKFKQLLGTEYENSGYVYTHDNGKPYRVNSVTEQFKAFLKKHNLPPLRLHDLRHTFASILSHEGVDIFSISQVLGHSDIGTTSKIYTHLFDKTHKNTIDVISSALKK